MISRLFLVCLTLPMFLMGMKPSAADETPPYQIVGYFSSWGIYDRQYFVTDIPADKLTVINYAFFLISNAGECTLGDEWADTQYPYPGDQDTDTLKGNFKQLQLLKQSHPGLQVVISVGGWTGSALFSVVAQTPEARAKFAASCVEFVTRYGFDGIDIDWEFPTGGGFPGNVELDEDPQNFPLLLAELRQQLDAQGAIDGKHYRLTIAASTGNKNFTDLDWGQIEPHLDWVNVMAYDFSGPWSAVTGFNAPLYDSTATPPEGGSADSVIRAYMAAGIPASKLILGVPFYGRSWAGVAAADGGLHQPYDVMPEGSSGGSYDYRTLAANGWLETFQRYWDDTAQVPWLYNQEGGMMVSYDDPESLGLKAAYVRDNGLGGVMIWELAADEPGHSLLDAVYKGLTGQGVGRTSG
jgi:chitinase